MWGWIGLRWRRGRRTVVAHVDDGVAPVLGIRLGEDHVRKLLCAHALQIPDVGHLFFWVSRKVLRSRSRGPMRGIAGTFSLATLLSLVPTFGSDRQGYVSSGANGTSVNELGEVFRVWGLK